jgi:hypothetical protein
MATDPILITLSTNLRALERGDFKLRNVLHCKADIEHYSDFSESEIAVGIAPGQYQAVNQATRKYLGKPERVVSTIDKTSFFADPEHRAELERDESSVLVIIYNGHGKPPATFADFDCASVCVLSGSVPGIVFETAPSAFKRMQLPNDDWKWCRTQIITSNISEGELETFLARINQALDPEEKMANAYCHHVAMKCQVIEVSRLLRSIVEGNNFVDGDVNISLARLHELARAIKTSAIPRTIPQDAHSADGLALLSGTSPTFYLDEASQLLVAEKAHIYITPDSKIHTLADLLIKQLTGTLSAEDCSARLKNMSRLLKGLRVSVRVAGMVEERVISAMWDGNSKSAPSGRRHHAWSSKRRDHLLADLPCVNVGSSWDPVLLPPELCRVLPGQDLRGTQTPCLSRSIESLRRSAPSGSGTPTGSMNGHLIRRPQSKNLETTRTVSKFGGVLPTVLFLQAGTDGVKSPCWDSVRQTLKNVIQSASQSSVPPSGPLLSLRYESTPGVETLWTQQIRNFVSMHEQPNQRMLLVVCLQSEDTHAAMYNIIKKACDTEAGIQSVFVNCAMLEAKLHNNPSQAATMVVGTICRSLRLRNPPMLPKSSSQAATHLVIGMHVESFTTPTRFVHEDGNVGRCSAEMFLVSLVSRALDSSVDYYTEVKLYSKAEYGALNIGASIQHFLKSTTSSQQNLTVLRSGYVAGGSPQLVDERLLKENTDIAKACAVAGKAFTYATLSEDRRLKVRVSDPTLSSPGDKHKALLVAEPNVQEDASKPCFWVFHDQEAVDGTGGIKVIFHHRTDTIPKADTPALPLRFADSLTPQGSTHKLRKVSRVAKPPPSPLQENRSPSPASKSTRTPNISKRQTSQPQADGSIAAANSKVPAQSVNPRSATQTEVATLDHIWKDDHLELYNTKWPIPTYLAQLALGRARRYLVTNDWEHRQKAPFSLPEVHKSVRDTLYYL